jgi:hypothetical protein
LPLPTGILALPLPRKGGGPGCLMNALSEFFDAIAADLARIWRGYTWPLRIVWLATLGFIAFMLAYGSIFWPH